MPSPPWWTTVDCVAGSAPIQTDAGDAECRPCPAGWHGTAASVTGLRRCEPCSAGTIQPLAGHTTCLRCPSEGVDCTVQDRFEVLPGWFLPAATDTNGSSLGGAAWSTFTADLVAAGAIDAFEDAAFAAQLRALLGCAAPACDLVLALTAASVHVEATVTASWTTSVAAAVAATLAELNSTELSEALGVAIEGTANVSEPASTATFSLASAGLRPARCPQRDSCLGGNSSGCAEGHEGPLCGRCAEGYYRSSGRCAQCDKDAAPSIALYCGGVVAALLFAFAFLFVQGSRSHRATATAEQRRRSSMVERSSSMVEPTQSVAQRGTGGTRGTRGTRGVRRNSLLAEGTAVVRRVSVQVNAGLSKSLGSKRRPLQTLCAQLRHRSKSLGTIGKILLAYFQVLNAFSQMPGIVWPPIFVSFLEKMRILSLDVFSASPLGCLLHTEVSFMEELLATLLLPIVGAALVLLLALLAACCTLPADERGVLKVAARPETTTLQLWLLLLLYPSLARKALAPFDCVTVGDMRLLRADSRVECDSGEYWQGLAALGTIGTIVYSLGFPLLCYGMTRAATSPTGDGDAETAAKPRPTGQVPIGGSSSKGGSRRTRGSRPTHGDKRLGRAWLLLKSYRPEFWWWESLEVLRKYFLTSVVLVVAQLTLLQVYLGALACVVSLVLVARHQPYADPLCGHVQMLVLAQLAFTYMSGMLFFDDGSGRDLDDGGERERRDADWGRILVAVNLTVFAALAAGLGHAVQGAIGDVKGAIRSRRTGQLMELPPQRLDVAWHLFVSHVWRTGQDQARVIKERLKRLVPGISVFLDVDDLDDVSMLEEYVAASHLILVFVSAGYLESKNCLRELSCAAQTCKPIVAVRETEREHGGMSDDEVRVACADASLLAALFAAPPIEWHRVSQFQDVSLLQVARRLVPGGVAPELYIPGGPMEALHNTPIPPPREHGGSLVYVSRHNVGAMALARELAAALESADAGGAAHLRQGSKSHHRRNGRAHDKASHGHGHGKSNSKGPGPMSVTQDRDELQNAGCLLLLLDAATWSVGQGGGMSARAPTAQELARKNSLTVEVGMAMQQGIKVVMAHERGGKPQLLPPVPFGRFFDEGQTPPHLLAWGIYADIAVALHGGEHRAVSLAILGANVLRAAGEPLAPRTGLVPPSTAQLRRGATLAAAAHAGRRRSSADSANFELSAEDDDSGRGLFAQAAQALPRPPTALVEVSEEEPQPSQPSEEPSMPRAVSRGAAKGIAEARRAMESRRANSRATDSTRQGSVGANRRGSVESKLDKSLRNLMAADSGGLPESEESVAERKRLRRLSLTAGDDEFSDARGTKAHPGRETTNRRARSRCSGEASQRATSSDSVADSGARSASMASQSIDEDHAATPLDAGRDAGGLGVLSGLESFLAAAKGTLALREPSPRCAVAPSDVAGVSAPSTSGANSRTDATRRCVAKRPAAKSTVFL